MQNNIITASKHSGFNYNIKSQILYFIFYIILYIMQKIKKTRLY